MRRSHDAEDEGRGDKGHGGATGDGEVLPEVVHVGRRVRPPLMTRADFERQWPEVSTSLRRALLSWGATPELSDDLVQQVALKALVSNEPASGPLRNFQAWCITAGRHLHIDHVRKPQSVAYEATDAVDANDVLSLVCDRIDLNAALAAMKALPERERRLLIDATQGTLPRHERKKALAVYQDVRRIRLKLRHELGAVLVALGSFLNARGRAAASKASGLVALSTVTALAVLLPVVTRPATASPGRQAEGPRALITPISALLDSTSALPSRAAARRCVAACATRAIRPTSPHRRPATGSTVRLVRSTPVGPAGFDSRPSSRQGKELVCVKDLPAGLHEVCVDEPQVQNGNFWAR